MTIEIDLEQFVKQIGEEKEPEKTPLDRDDWMVQLSLLEESFTLEAIKHIDGYRFWERKILETGRIRRKVEELESNGYRLDFFSDEEGNLSFEPHKKDKVGFKHP